MEQFRPETKSSAHAPHDHFDPRKKYSRREMFGFLRNAVAAAVAAQLTLTLEPDAALSREVQASPRLSEAMDQVRMALQPGGEWYEALRKPSIEARVYESILTHSKRIAIEMRDIYFGRNKNIDDREGVEKYIQRFKIPGLVKIKTTEKGTSTALEKKIGLKEWSCNAFYLKHAQSVKLVTAAHCIEGTNEAPHFTVHPDGEDVAAWDRPQYTGNSLTIDDSLTRDSVAGSLGFTVGDKENVPDAFFAPLIPVGKTTLDDMFPQQNIPPEVRKRLEKGFWKVLPQNQWQSDDVAAEGRSGSIELAFDAKRGGYAPAGFLIAVARPTGKPFDGYVIGFYTGPEALKKMFSN